MDDATKNLQVSRSSKSVWDEPGWPAALSTYDQQRWMTAAFGVVLAIGGSRRGGFGGGFAAMAGAVLAVRAAMGRHDLVVAREWVESQLVECGWRAPDQVQDASEDSFPASDAPSFTPTTGASRR